MAKITIEFPVIGAQPKLAIGSNHMIGKFERKRNTETCECTPDFRSKVSDVPQDFDATKTSRTRFRKHNTFILQLHAEQ